MSEYDFAIKDAERFVDMLQQRLTDLDVVKKSNGFFDRIFSFVLGQCGNCHGIGEGRCAIDEYVR